MVIQQGEVYWVDVGAPKGRGLAYRRPHVVVQGNPFNDGGTATVVVCAITSNINRADFPGNVLLQKGEANLTKDSLVIGTELHAVDRNYLVDRIGNLSSERVEEIIKSIKMVLDTD